ncbi:MAG: hypothetical protein AAF628_17305 [Planctomycetota bacterium]
MREHHTGAGQRNGHAGAAASPQGRGTPAELDEAVWRLAMDQQRRLGRRLAEIERLDRHLEALERKCSDRTQTAERLALQREELEQQIRVTEQQLRDLRGRLRERLGDWCSLEDFEDRAETIVSQLRTVNAVRASLTWKVVRALTLPGRLLGPRGTQGK